MKMRRLLAVTAVSMLALTSLTACGGGGDSTDAYCSAIDDAKAKFNDLNNIDPSQIGEVATTFGDIAAKAPDSVKDQWASLDDAFTQLTDALGDLGIDPSDLTDPSALAGIDPQKLQDLQSLSSKLNSSDLSTATDDITAEVKSDCNIDLNA
jgi:hypothetical protein